jgi:hypothetical protein
MFLSNKVKTDATTATAVLCLLLYHGFTVMCTQMTCFVGVSSYHYCYSHHILLMAVSIKSSTCIH